MINKKLVDDFCRLVDEIYLLLDADRINYPKLATDLEEANEILDRLLQKVREQ